jgi:hypothetical protein
MINAVRQVCKLAISLITNSTAAVNQQRGAECARRDRPKCRSPKYAGGYSMGAGIPIEQNGFVLLFARSAGVPKDWFTGLSFLLVSFP